MQDASSKLVFRKRHYRRDEDDIDEQQFISLCYIQCQHDFTQGNYAVSKEVAAEMCALQMQAEHASTLMDDDEGIMLCVEKYVHKEVSVGTGRDRRVWTGVGKFDQTWEILDWIRVGSTGACKRARLEGSALLRLVCSPLPASPVHAAADDAPPRRVEGRRVQPLQGSGAVQQRRGAPQVPRQATRPAVRPRRVLPRQEGG